MKLITRLLLIATGALCLLFCYFGGKYLYETVTGVEGFFDFFKQLFTMTNLFITLLILLSFGFGIKNIIRGLIKGRSILIVVSAVLYIVLGIFFYKNVFGTDLSQHALLPTIFAFIGIISVLSLSVGVLSIILIFKK